MVVKCDRNIQPNDKPDSPVQGVQRVFLTSDQETLRIYGITEVGNSVMAHVHNFEPESESDKGIRSCQWLRLTKQKYKVRGDGMRRGNC